VRSRLFRIKHELGSLGMAALVLMGVAMAFSALVVTPLEKRNEVLKASVKKSPRENPSGAKVEAVYDFLKKDAETTDWLAKLYGIGKATGVELKSASYKTEAEAGRVERYEIVLPATGSYSQIRDFLKRALAEIPVLSLDQVSLKRENRGDGVVNAELRLTLHKVKP
jgi:Tfp pilus assembly protein PilO